MSGQAAREKAKNEKDRQTTETMLQEKCQTIYHNLLRSLEIREVTAPIYLREWWQTEQCDKFFDLSTVRKNIEDDVTNSSLNRILTFQETIEDEARAAQTMTHYRDWHRKQLLKSFTWFNWGYYYLHDRTQDMLATLGLISLPYGGYRAALRIYKTRSDMKKAIDEAMKNKNSK